MLTVMLLSLALSQAPGYEWRECSVPDQVALYKDSKQVGLYWRTTDKYYPLAEGRFGEPTDCPVSVPGKAEKVRENHGLVLDRIDQKPSYQRNGKACSRREAMDAMASVPDDRTWLRITVIGPDATRVQVLNDLKSHPSLAPWKGKTVVQDYAPSDWAVRDAGFVTTGQPTIYVQMPTGKVLHRQDSYQGADELAGALRKADPSYKPESDPNVNSPSSIPGLPTDWKKYLPYALAGLAVFLIWRAQK